MKIFLSYRRRDTGGMAGRLADRLQAQPGVSEVFIDVDAIGAGEDFVAMMLAATSASDIVLVLIGSAWLGSGDSNRLMMSDDPVRLEIEAALQQLQSDNQKRVIPILVDDATMPSRQQLPESLHQLITANAKPLRHASFVPDLGELLDALGLKNAAKPQRTVRDRLLRASLWALAGVLVFSLAALGNKWLSGGSLERTLGSSEAVVITLLTVVGAAIWIAVWR